MLTRVVKVGGSQLDSPQWLAACARALARLQPLVVVHGGGKAVDRLCARLGLEVEKRDGLRVTDAETAEAVEMVLAGPANRTVVAALRHAGLDAIGLAGVDGGLLTAEPAPGGLGQVGQVAAVRRGLLESLLLAGLTPVIAPVAPSSAAGGGAVPLNVNADDAAAAVAAALGADELLFVSDVPAVVADGVAQPAVAASEIESLIAARIVAGGMAAKLRAAARALGAGVRAVRIGDLELLEGATAGTRISAVAPSPQPA